MKINDKAGIRGVFAARPDLEKVYVLEDGRHYFNEAHAKCANGLEEKKGTDGKVTQVAKAVKYTALKADDKQLQDEPTEAPKA